MQNLTVFQMAVILRHHRIQGKAWRIKAQGLGKAGLAASARRAFETARYYERSATMLEDHIVEEAHYIMWELSCMWGPDQFEDVPF